MSDGDAGPIDAAEERRRASAARDAHRRHDERWRGYAAQQQRAHERAIADLEARRAELAAALAELDAATRSLVGSRRWAVANRIGDLRDRIGRGREVGREQRRVDAALARAADARRRLTEAARVADDTEATRRAPDLPAPPPAPPGAEPAGTRALFHDLGSYLRTATTDPLLPAPYDEPARRVIGAMDSLRRMHLRAAADRDPATFPLVSVVLAAHGDLDQLTAAVASVTAQTYPRWELVLAGPHAAELAAAVPGSTHRVRVVPADEARPTDLPALTAVDPGAASADPRWADHTAALHAAEGRYVAHLDVATRWEPDRVAVLVHVLDHATAADHGAGATGSGLRADPRPRLVYAAEELTARDAAAGTPQVVGIRFAPYHRALLENRGTIALGAVVHDRALTDAHGGIDPTFGPAAGWELVLRLTAHAEVTAVPCLLGRTDVTGRGGVEELTRPADLLDRAPDAAPDPAVAEVDARHLGPTLDLPGAAEVVGDAQLHALPAALRRTGRPRPTTVVIPSYQAPDELALCLGSLLACSPRDHLDIVVVDNASDDATQAVLDEHVAAGTIQLHRNDRNLGFTQAVNQGIIAAGERDVVLLNNDAVVTPGWLEGLWAALDAVDDAGLVVPRHTLLPGSLAARSHVPCADVSREVDVNLSILHANVLDPDPGLPDGLVGLSFAPFFAVYVPRRTINEVGLLNVEHGPHYRSDRLYCDTVRHGARRRIVYTPASKLYHLRRRSTRTLKRTDPAMYEAMYVFNDWQRISGGRPAAG